MSENKENAEHPLAPFQAALLERKAEIADKLAERAFPELRSLVDEKFHANFRGRRLKDVEDYAEALIDPEARNLRERFESWVAAPESLRIPPSVMQQLYKVTREVLLEAGLELRAAGVPEANAGILRLMAVAGLLTRTFDAAFRARAMDTHKTLAVFEKLIEATPHGIGVATPDGTILYANAAFHRLFDTEDATGKPIQAFVAPEEQTRFREEVNRSVADTGGWVGNLVYMREDGSRFEAHLTSFAVRDEAGRKIARCAILRDLTALKHAEDEQRKLAAEVIAAQQRALEELGTPLVPIAEGVLVMPLVGRIDRGRAERMLGVLLSGIEEQAARVVLLDITGVKTADREAASALVRAARAAKLLGAEVVLTGIGPDLARTFVELDADFGSLETKATLGDGVAHALGKTRRKRV